MLKYTQMLPPKEISYRMFLSEVGGGKNHKQANQPRSALHEEEFNF